MASRKPRKVFGPVKPCLDHLYPKTEKCICLKLRVHSFGRIRIRISDPRSLRSWRTTGTELWFLGSVTMTIGAKSVETTKTCGKIARSRYNKQVKPAITSQAMIQNKGCHLEGCVHEYSGVIRQFCGKTETKFCTTRSNICISLALSRFSGDFHSIKGRNRFKF